MNDDMRALADRLLMVEVRLYELEDDREPEPEPVPDDEFGPNTAAMRALIETYVRETEDGWEIDVRFKAPKESVTAGGAA